MKIHIVTFLALISITSCKKDPNKQVDEGTVKDNIYHSKEIGWTMEIPKGWNVTQREVTQERQDNGLKAIAETNNIEYDASGLKQLISFQKDKFHIFSSSSEKYEPEYNGDYEENKALVKQLLYDTYTGQGIKVDTISSTEKVDHLEFDLLQITVYGPQGNIMLYQDLYSKLINGRDFAVNLNYINEEEKAELMRVWKNSKFE